MPINAINLKIKPIPILLIILVFSANFSFADSILKIQDEISIVAVNGKETRSTGKLILPDGTNQIVAQAVGEINSSGDWRDREIIESDIFVIKFNAKNENLILSIPLLQNSYEFEMFNKNPKFILSNTSGNSIDVKISRLGKKGFQVFRDFEEELEKFNKTSSEAAVLPTQSHSKQSDFEHATQPTTNALADPPTADMRTKEEVNIAEKMLKYWYQQASQETRERFKSWINK